MTPRWVPALIAWGCAPQAGPDVRGFLWVGLEPSGDLAEAPGDAGGPGARVQQVDAQVGQVVVDGMGPTGPISVSAVAHRRLSWGPSASLSLDPVPIDLVAGAYDDVRVTVVLEDLDDGTPALVAVGREANVVMALTVQPSLSLRSEAIDRLIVGAQGEPTVWLALDTGAWFDGLSADDLGFTGNRLELPDDAPGAYDEVVANIVGAIGTRVDP